MSKHEILPRSKPGRSQARPIAVVGLAIAASIAFLACSAPPPPPPAPPPPPTPLPTPVVVPLAEPDDLAREVLGDAGFGEIDEDGAGGTIVARLRRSVATAEEERAAVAELRRIARFDEEFGSERIAGYEIRVEIRIKQTEASELDVAAKAEIHAAGRARVAALPPPPSRQLVSRGVLERELVERIHARWSE
jgi:hypothetical protein